MQLIHNRSFPKSMSLLTIVMLFLSSFVIFVGCSKAPTEKLVEDALVLAQKEDMSNWDEVCQKLEICIKRGVTESNVISLYILGKEKLGDREQAISMGLKALEQNPESFMLNYFVGKMYFEDKKFRTALHYLGRCHNQRPDHIDTLLLMIHCAEKVNLTLALNLYSRLMSTDKFGSSFLLHNGLGVFHARLGEFSRAMSAFSQALKLSDGHPLVYLNTAVLCDQYMQKPAIARQHYSNYLKKAGDQFPEKSKKVTARLKKITPLKSPL